jgi:pimeloyl-ACP methyl ester carboxylesterase
MIVYIHGASATCESFNYITQNIPAFGMCLGYDSKNGFKENLSVMSEALKDTDEIFFVAHSLGGIYSLHLAEMFSDKVRGAVTLSTPYGGSQAADYVKYFLPFSRLMRDIGPHSEPMEKINKINIKWPWTNVVTVNGASPFMTEPNDGVVTIASMKHLEKKMEIIEMPINHYEVVITDPVIDIIKKRLPADFISKLQ